MKHTKETKLIKQFDTPETLLVVSLYPKAGETYSKGTTGVASYTKNLVTNMNRPVVVFANELPGKKIYTEENSLVLRCFTPDTVTLWQNLLASISQFKQAKKVLLQFDFSMYGNMLISAAILPFIAYLKLRGFRVSVVSHHVIQDVNKLSGHLGLTHSMQDIVKAKLYNFSFSNFYRMLGLTATSVIVLEETLKNTMSVYMPSKKVIAIPHAVDTNVQKINNQVARKKLGYKRDEQIVLFFGFVNWFKGADYFVEAFKDVDSMNNKPIRFVLAGGESPTMKSKDYYQKYFAKVVDTANNSHRVEITGYVPQEQIHEYFSAADLIVFPYRHFMCASGVLSLTFSYSTPFIVSEPLTNMFMASDIQNALSKANIKSTEITFQMTKRDTIKITEKVLENGLKKKLIKVGTIMRNTRSFKNNARLYEQALFANTADLKVDVNEKEYAIATAQ